MTHSFGASDFPDEAGHFQTIIKAEEGDHSKVEGELKNSYQPQQLTATPTKSFHHCFQLKSSLPKCKEGKLACKSF